MTPKVSNLHPRSARWATWSGFLDAVRKAMIPAPALYSVAERRLGLTGGATKG
nr:hypothetical protein OG999_44530 [Streptomyces sp. NBC_00886]